MTPPALPRRAPFAPLVQRLRHTLSTPLVGVRLYPLVGLAAALAACWVAALLLATGTYHVQGRSRGLGLAFTLVDGVPLVASLVALHRYRLGVVWRRWQALHGLRREPGTSAIIRCQPDMLLSIEEARAFWVEHDGPRVLAKVLNERA